MYKNEGESKSIHSLREENTIFLRYQVHPAIRAMAIANHPMVNAGGIWTGDGALLPQNFPRKHWIVQINDYVKCSLVPPKDYHQVWCTRQLDPQREPMGLRQRGWHRPQPPPRMARTTKRDPAKAGTRRIVVAVVAVCLAVHRSVYKNSAVSSAPSSLRDWHPQPSDGTPRKLQHDVYRGDSRLLSYAAPDLPMLH